MIVKIIFWLKKHEPPVWFLWLLIAVLILRIPSVFEPYSYGDEMIYLTLGEAVRRGITLYKYIHDNKPPLLYLIAGLSGNLMMLKVILGFWSLVTIYLYYRLMSLMSKNRTLVKIATIAFGILTTIPTFEGNIANAEVFMVGPTILAMILLLKSSYSTQRHPRPDRGSIQTKAWIPCPSNTAGRQARDDNRCKIIINLLLAGVLFAIAVLFKFPAIFDIPVVFLYWLLTKKPLKKTLAGGILVFTGFATLILGTFVYYFAKGAGPEYLVAAFLQNLGYVSSWTASAQLPFWQKNAGLLIRFGILVVISLGLFLKHHPIKKEFLFFVLWLIFALFAVTLSERPYPHYFVQALPAVAYFLALLFVDKSIYQVISILPLSLAIFVLVYFKFWYYPTTPYYTRFLRYATGQSDKKSYYQDFDRKLPVYYQIAQKVTAETQPSDPVLVWGDAPTIYALSKRLPPIKYVAGYHINDFYSWDKVLTDITTRPPKIIVLEERFQNEKIMDFLEEHYGFVAFTEGFQIWKLINP
ncbi:hypothetical protein A2188_00905 [Candidatus Woesebacteria bacterium RIFOXYA1_FULL_43_9]|uniref:Glycosyltransferase RgtA/B/C/D-like domain-containing protein n=1 Tax=Candidatus Woesebacteria bacterium RIFOXYA1_FULL_43_9 TaxID=1802534 RepID=A0A1F8CPF6_9BACT|nr:MAG: hypothetical protein A2188_00905 [Candidatus Woesebacteria bacterium RIFOXYA1_FULL_43_9]